MAKPVSNAPITSEPKTSLGQFYRAHRTEVLAGGGIAVAGVFYWRAKKNSSATSSTSATASADAIDPATGVPYATELSNAQSGIASTSPNPDGSSYGDGGDTGYSGGGGGYGDDILSQLAQIESDLPNPGGVNQPDPNGSVSISSGQDKVYQADAKEAAADKAARAKAAAKKKAPAKKK